MVKGKKVAAARKLSPASSVKNSLPSKGYLIVTLIIIAILSASFFFALSQAIFMQPQSSNCYSPKTAENGSLISPTSQESQQCYSQYQEAQNKYQSQSFYAISLSALAVIVIILVFFTGLGGIAWYVNTGIILGALFAILTATMRSYDALSRPLRPIILIVEIGIVVWVAYKRLKK